MPHCCQSETENDINFVESQQLAKSFGDNVVDERVFAFLLLSEWT
jgi:hypothetical protein